MIRPPLLLATRNAGKRAEFERLLGATFAMEPLPREYPEPPENGATYFENVLLKALRAHEALGKPVLADDSGLEVDALSGDPGVHTARYGGAGLTYPQRWDFLYAELAPLDESRWTAQFRAVLCYYDGNRPPLFFEGVVRGRVVKPPRGEKGFGYDPIFFCPEIGKTLAEADPVEKHAVSHRGRAARQFLAWWMTVTGNLTAPATPSSFT